MFYDKFLFFIPVFGVFPVPFVGNVSIGLLLNVLCIFSLFVLYLGHLKNQKYYSNGFLKKYTSYLIGWGMGDGKTRLMTKISMEISEKKRESIIIANYNNSIADCYFQSKKDFLLLQKDIQALSLYLNFDLEAKKAIEKDFPWYFSYSDHEKTFKTEFRKIKELAKWKLDFATFGDEFHLYLHNRNSMGNFSGDDGKKLLEMMHQTRHSKQLLMMASQDTDTLDLDIRQISDKEIEVKEFFNGLFFGFNLHKYLNLKYQNLNDKLAFQKINRIPFVFLNYYLFFKTVEKLDNLQFKAVTYAYSAYNKRFKKARLYTYRINNPFKSKRLPYDTNFNVNININVYSEWLLYKKIIKKLDV